MNVRYDRSADVLTIRLREGTVAESDEERPGVILDLDAEGRVLAIEILNASRQVELPGSVTLEVAAK
jgi:uncharacterized protein YuzE